ncbi:MAG: proton-conducting transporter membrane subunit [Pseudomonadota bacterium]
MSPVLMFVLPLLAAFLLPLVARASGAAGRLFGPLVLAVNCVIGLQAWEAVSAQTQVFALGGFAPPFGVVFYVDRLALLFAIAVSLGVLLLWPSGGADADGQRERTLTLVLAAAATGLALSGDLFNIYVFYELTAVASYGLAAARRSGPAYAAAIRYVVISSFGAALMLIGIALVYMSTGTLNLAQLAQLAPGALDGPLGLAAFVFILIGAGVKAELFPVNTWVPEVYAAASRRVAGLLAGIVSKLALLILVRLLVLVFRQPEAQQIMLLLGVLGVVTGELAAWYARDLARMLAYSSIGQLGVMFIAFSIPGAAGLYAGLAVALHHMVVKPALFLLAERQGGALHRLAGSYQAAPLACALFVLLALSLIGIPPLPGFWAKFLVVTTALAQPGPAYLLAVCVILLAAVVEASYLFRVVVQLYRHVPEATAGAGHAGATLTVSAGLGLALVAAVFWLAPLGDTLQGIADRAADRDAYIETVYPAGVPL